MTHDALVDAVRAALSEIGLAAPAEIDLERPARREHGDWSTNVALALAKSAGRSPREVAADLVARLDATRLDGVERVEIAGPGFVNFHLGLDVLHDAVRSVVEHGVAGYARHDVGAGRTVNIEFVSANPTGPLHAGHGRLAAYGDAVARLFERCGWTVHRECYVNDRGVQMATFAASLAARARGDDPPDDGYHGQYVSQWAAEMPAGADPLVWGEERALADHRATLARMNVAFDTWFSEQSLVESGAIDDTLDDLRRRGVVAARDGATWLLSSGLGDDKDRVLIKSDGEYTYLLPDIAYHRNKLARSDLLVDVWGADHHGYVSRMRAAVQALGHDPAELEVVIVQLVNLVEAGEPVRLSKRAGDIIELADVLDEVGPDAARLTFLLQSVDTRQTFDYDVVKAQANENPVFYVQYAHARIHSMAREAQERGVARRPFAEVDLTVLAHERELDLMRALGELPEVVLDACAARAPHRVSSWVRDFAGRFHGFYHDCPVLRTDVPDGVQQARLWLVEASRIGVAIGLDLLGVDAPESM